MYCKNCNKDITDGLAFCDICGADLNAGALAGFDNSAITYDPTKNPGKKLSIASLVLGITSMVTNFSCCLSFFPVLGNIISVFSLLTIPCGVIGFILGIIARKKSINGGFKNKKATAGIITSIIAIITGVITIIIGILYLLGFLGVGVGVGALGFAILTES